MLLRWDFIRWLILFNGSKQIDGSSWSNREVGTRDVIWENESRYQRWGICS